MYMHGGVGGVIGGDGIKINVVIIEPFYKTFFRYHKMVSDIRRFKGHLQKCYISKQKCADYI